MSRRGFSLTELLIVMTMSSVVATASVGMVLVLAVGFLFQAVIGQAQDLMIILGHQRTNIAIGIGSIVLNVILSIVLVPHFGILGVAIATAATYGVRAIVYAVAIRHLHGVWVLADMPRFERLRGALTGSANAAPPAAE